MPYLLRRSSVDAIPQVTEAQVVSPMLANSIEAGHLPDGFDCSVAVVRLLFVA